MIYLGYGMTYAARAGLVKQGRWTEFQLLYQHGSRYHVLPLAGLAAVVSAVLATWRPIRRCDTRRGLPAVVGTAASLVMLVVQHHEVNTCWNWMLHQPGQMATLAALRRVGCVAREEGITRDQLLRIIDPAYRPWNASLVGDCLYAFPLVKLVAEAPTQVARPLGDDVARSLLRNRLTREERMALASGACVSLNPARPGPHARTIAVARRVQINQAREIEPGHYVSDQGPGAIVFEFDPTPGARFLMLPGLKADQDVVIAWSDRAGRWRPGQNVRWLHAPRPEAPAVVDLERLICLEKSPLTRVAVRLALPGDAGPPRPAPPSARRSRRARRMPCPCVNESRSSAGDKGAAGFASAGHSKTLGTISGTWIGRPLKPFRSCNLLLNHPEEIRLPSDRQKDRKKNAFFFPTLRHGATTHW